MALSPKMIRLAHEAARKVLYTEYEITISPEHVLDYDSPWSIVAPRTHRRGARSVQNARFVPEIRAKKPNVIST